MRYSTLVGAFALASCSAIVDGKLSDKPHEAELADAAAQDRDASSVEADGASRPTRDAGSSSDAGEPGADAGAPARPSYRLALGDSHGCALSSEGALTCWGDNMFGQTDMPERAYVAFATGAFHTCAIDQAGALVCAGRNQRGQSPSAPGPFVEVAAGDAHTCALAASGEVACWGDDTEGQATPPEGVLFERLAAGIAFSCGLVRDTHAVRCWGRGKIGYENGATGLAIAELAGADNVLCVVERGSGVPHCYNNDYTAPDVSGLRGLSVGDVACGLADGQLVCWPGTYVQTSPDIGEGLFEAVAAGPFAVCVLPVGGTLRCRVLQDSLAGAVPPNFP